MMTNTRTGVKSSADAAAFLEDSAIKLFITSQHRTTQFNLSCAVTYISNIVSSACADGQGASPWRRWKYWIQNVPFYNFFQLKAHFWYFYMTALWSDRVWYICNCHPQQPEVKISRNHLKNPSWWLTVFNEIVCFSQVTLQIVFNVEKNWIYLSLCWSTSLFG